MKEILVHANTGHEGASLISPIWDLDNRCMYLRAISLMMTRPLQEKVDGPITEKQRQRNKNGRRYATYAAYNTSHETIFLPKNQIVGRCQLIFQPSEGVYLQEISAMRQEGVAEQQGLDTDVDEEELSRDWVIENFGLQDYPIIRTSPKVGKELIQVLQKKGKAFVGGAMRDQVIRQGVAGRKDWIIARFKLKPGEETPVNMK